MIFCSSCYHIFDHSVPEGQPCPVVGCNGETVHFDDHMFPIILALDEKGYIPTRCCGGHFWQTVPCTYIELGVYLNEAHKAPQGFDLVRDVGTGTTTISKTYDKGISTLELNSQLAETVRSLSDWVKTLAHCV